LKRRRNRAAAARHCSWTALLDAEEFGKLGAIRDDNVGGRDGVRPLLIESIYPGGAEARSPCGFDVEPWVVPDVDDLIALDS
jgi:hypothetical protein